MGDDTPVVVPGPLPTLPQPDPITTQSPVPTAPASNNPVSGTDWGQLAAGLWSAWQAANGTAGTNAATVAGIADPFAPQRAQYQKQLSGLLSDPASFKIDPGTQYAIGAANDATTRAANAMGVSRGGSVLSDISKNTVGLSEADYNQRIAELATLSGATTGSPAAAAAATAAGQANQNGNIAGGIAGLAPLFAQLAQMGMPASLISQLQKQFGGTGGAAGDPGEPGGGTGGNGEPGGPDGPLMPVMPNPGEPGYVPPPIDPISTPPTMIQDPPPIPPTIDPPPPWDGPDGASAGTGGSFNNPSFWGNEMPGF